jgi:hypothetical protein
MATTMTTLINAIDALETALTTSKSDGVIGAAQVTQVETLLYCAKQAVNGAGVIANPGS